MKKKLPYDDIEILVYAYQEGSKDAMETLLRHYNGYFHKFLNVLKKEYSVTTGTKTRIRYSKFDVYNVTQRRFAVCFMKTRHERETAHGYKKFPAIRVKIMKTVVHIRRLFANFEADDLLQIMRMTFIEMARAHKGTKFYNFVSTTFPKVLLSHLIKLLREPEHEPFYEDMVFDYGYIYSDTYFFEQHRNRVHVYDPSDTHYDLNWVNGEALEPFDHLSPYERRLLKLYYEEKTWFRKDFSERELYESRKLRLRRKDSDLADMFACSRKTINEKRNLAIASVREIALENRMIEG